MRLNYYSVNVSIPPMSSVPTDPFKAFDIEPVFDLENAKSVLKRKFDPSVIKERPMGDGSSNKMMKYVEGHNYVKVLNEAFGDQWSFRVVDRFVIPSVPKPAYEWKEGKGGKKFRVPKKDEYGNQVFEEQPPVVHVLVELTVPKLGTRAQWGSAVLLGGASEQQSAFKAATTDALKKAASLFGIGLELYEDEMIAMNGYVQNGQYNQQQYGYSQQGYNNQYQGYQQSYQANNQARNGYNGQGSVQDVWPPESIKKITELKQKLGIIDNSQLTPFAREFFEKKGKMNATYQDIQPDNIEEFNKFLEEKLMAMTANTSPDVAEWV